eukprot:1595858-Lingulodinium_polyedra.AAC.1
MNDPSVRPRLNDATAPDVLATSAGSAALAPRLPRPGRLQWAHAPNALAPAAHRNAPRQNVARAMYI